MAEEIHDQEQARRRARALITDSPDILKTGEELERLHTRAFQSNPEVPEIDYWIRDQVPEEIPEESIELIRKVKHDDGHRSTPYHPAGFVNNLRLISWHVTLFFSNVKHNLCKAMNIITQYSALQNSSFDRLRLGVRQIHHIREGLRSSCEAQVMNRQAFSPQNFGDYSGKQADPELNVSNGCEITSKTDSETELDDGTSHRARSRSRPSAPDSQSETTGDAINIASDSEIMIPGRNENNSATTRGDDYGSFKTNDEAESIGDAQNEDREASPRVDEEKMLDHLNAFLDDDVDDLTLTPDMRNSVDAEHVCFSPGFDDKTFKAPRQATTQHGLAIHHAPSPAASLEAAAHAPREIRTRSSDTPVRQHIKLMPATTTQNTLSDTVSVGTGDGGRRQFIALVGHMKAKAKAYEAYKLLLEIKRHSLETAKARYRSLSIGGDANRQRRLEVLQGREPLEEEIRMTLQSAMRRFLLDREGGAEAIANILPDMRNVLEKGASYTESLEAVDAQAERIDAEIKEELATLQMHFRIC